MTAPAPGPHTVAVVGAGVTGLVAARRLAQKGRRVILVERSDRIGGQVRTLDLAGRRVDVGAEAVHLASPVARRVVDELGLTDSVVASRPGPSWLWTSRGRRPLPAGVGPAGPTRLRPVLRSGVMSATGLVRAGLEPVFTRLRGPLDLEGGQDTSVGHFVTSRFGREVTDRFVDPLLGSLHAGDVNHLSLRACAPALVPAAAGGRSLVLRRKGGAGPRTRPLPSSGTPSPGGPTTGGGRPLPAGALFASWSGGLGTLTEALLADVDVDVRLGRTATALERSGTGYRLELDDGERLDVEGVVLAVPSHVAGQLLEPLLGEAAAPLRAQRFASVATVVLGVPREAVAGLKALEGNGILVPSGTGTLLKAVTHLSTKWPHLEDGDTYLLRLSAGRDGSDVLADLDDEALVARLRVELERFTGITAEPTLVHVERWDAGLPQLHVGHLDRLASVRDALDDVAPGVVLAGASYDGVGLAACLASAEVAAETLLVRRAAPPA